MREHLKCRSNVFFGMLATFICHILFAHPIPHAGLQVCRGRKSVVADTLEKYPLFTGYTGILCQGVAVILCNIVGMLEGS